jgi:hypothetical protein
MKSTRLMAVVGVAGMATVAAAQTTVFDAGPAQTVNWDPAATSTFTPTFLGWSSGDLISVGRNQRWAATPFTLAAAATINQFDVNGFINPGNEFNNFKWAIWRRNAGNPAPVPADQVATGTEVIPTLVPDPRVAQTGNGAGMYSLMLATPVNLPAGDYYITVYGDGPVVPGTDTNFGWFTNAQLDITLTPSNTPIPISNAGGNFLWRASTYPSPGFQVYTVPTTQMQTNPAPTSGPGSPGHPTIAQDPQYLYNPSFTLKGPSGPAPCYANCDGSTTPPILNVNDFICFQGKYAAGDPTANCDESTTPPILNVNDFICFQGKYAAGCP